MYGASSKGGSTTPTTKTFKETTSKENVGNQIVPNREAAAIRLLLRPLLKRKIPTRMLPTPLPFMFSNSILKTMMLFQTTPTPILLAVII
jgi:hypothetical protein